MENTESKGLNSEKEEFEATKCSFKANGHTNCSKTIKDYGPLRKIHTNESCQVYEVEDTVTKEHFTLKLCKKGDFNEFQNNEIRNLTYLHDIEGDFVRCEHLFTTKTHNIFVLELLMCDFKGFLDGRGSKLSLKTARVVVKKLARIMIILHNNGIIYADLIPENIMIDKNGNLKLIDFDQSYKIGETYTKSFLPCGNLLHMGF
ncbi:rim15, signal transduction response regulator [Bonamia ostreae]|uniref:Rim15, signal transduction response regulator n=1 Tax=Bonamia ostreae TaxID=126728 RepID=A0ABV2AQP6_9EUKA